MAFADTDIKEYIRSEIPNLSTAELSDQDLDLIIEQSIRRLSRDKPHAVSQAIAGSLAEDTNGHYFQLVGSSPVLTDWIDEFSEFVEILSPEPIIADGDIPQIVHPNTYQVVELAGDTYLRFDVGVDTAKNVNFTHTTEWAVSGINGAATTTVPSRYENAIEFITVSFALLALANQAAGRNNSALPGDLINWRSKSSEFKLMAREFEDKYNEELGIKPDATIAAGGFVDVFDPHLSSGGAFLTHGRRRNK